MKHFLKIGILCFLPGSLLMAQEKMHITLENPSDFIRNDEAIILSRKSLIKGLKSGTEEKLPLFKKADGSVLPSQTDDLDGDGKWDEAVFLLTLQPLEKTGINVSFVKAGDFPKFKQRAHARMAKMDASGKFMPITAETMPEGMKPTDFSKTKLPLYHTEGPAWENDKVAFRLYFDPRNGKDIYGKTTSEMMMDRIGLGENYHEKSWWGMDILKLGNSLGAGSLAIIGKEKDHLQSVVKLGEHVEKTSYELISDGPVRAIFRMKYKNWQVSPEEKYDVTEEISIVGGQYYYESKVTISGFTGERQLVTGIVNLLSDKAIQEIGEKDCLLATFDKQSENKDNLGMAVLVKKSSFLGFDEAPESGPAKVQQTYFVKLKSLPGVPVSFRFFAGWEAADEQFKNAGLFQKFLEKERIRMSDTVKVNLKSQK